MKQLLIFLMAIACPACAESTLPDPDSGGDDPTEIPGEMIFRDDFESGSLAGWEDGVDPARHRVVNDAARAFSGSRYLEITYPAGQDGGWLTRFFMPGFDTVFVQYHVYFPQDWEGSTKLIALYGSHVDNQWSAHGQAGQCPTGTDFFNTMVVTESGTGHPGDVRFYTYFPGMSASPGGQCWGNFGPAEYHPPLHLERGRWHRIEFEVVLNTPGQANGRQRIWIDGTLRGEWTDLRFRDTTDLRLNSVQITADNVPRATTQHMRVDNLVVTQGGTRP